MVACDGNLAMCAIVDVEVCCCSRVDAAALGDTVARRNVGDVLADRIDGKHIFAIGHIGKPCMFAPHDGRSECAADGRAAIDGDNPLGDVLRAVERERLVPIVHQLVPGAADANSEIASFERAARRKRIRPRWKRLRASRGAEIPCITSRVGSAEREGAVSVVRDCAAEICGGGLREIGDVEDVLHADRLNLHRVARRGRAVLNGLSVDGERVHHGGRCFEDGSALGVARIRHGD